MAYFEIVGDKEPLCVLRITAVCLLCRMEGVVACDFSECLVLYLRNLCAK